MKLQNFIILPMSWVSAFRRVLLASLVVTLRELRIWRC